jgi:hypothetical protein
MSIERLRFQTHFWNQLTLEKALEILRISGLWLGEHALVHELVNSRALHGWEVFVAQGDGEIVASEFEVFLRRRRGTPRIVQTVYCLKYLLILGVGVGRLEMNP